MVRKQGNMKWWQLSLVGIGCTIGTGYFLGSSIAIEQSGAAVLWLFLFAAIGTYFVYESLAKLSIEYPDKGSFRTYAKKAFGDWAGFSNGWVYCLSELLIMGSQLIALGIFTRFWFPNLPLWLCMVIFAVLGLAIILTGLAGFEKMENIFGIMKASAIIMFILVAVLLLVKGTESLINPIPHIFSGDLPSIWWGGFIYAFYAFGGIEIMGLVATDLKNKQEALKAGRWMLLGLGSIYIIALGLALAFIDETKIIADESPFITALQPFDIPLIADVFNGVFIIAGFSTMVASLYAIITILVSLSEDHHAPAFLSKKGRLKIPFPAFVCLIVGLFVSIFIALLLPDRIFEYITTAAGLMLLYNWLFILASFMKLQRPTRWNFMKPIIAGVLIIIAVATTLFAEISRIGFFVSIGFIIMIAIAVLMMKEKWHITSSS
ncbi:amino acid transporter [Oceanobacillus iheyensis HTE831]|uniref:Amino acid transporter n=1 Tax=Oceanobacillus iheyensis (strain DSM 14371 / CIP 107618 / JCM 11309 / KCTC 3954 / HTE831) TaxID=221109 RepID=Q8ELM6_OCEIH|nr:amino acid permease [Oceanobacillus iheyensis]BAC15152.1 amino acid transporter [Oceanobacillus iheyensis HTE831]